MDHKGKYYEQIFIIDEFMAGRNLVQALERGMQIIEAVAAADEGLTLAELARHLKVRPPTAHNLARTLVLHGWVDRSSTPVRYRIGPSIFRMVRRHEHRRLMEVSAMLFEEMAPRLSGAVLVLAEPVGGDMTASLRMDTTPPIALERLPQWIMPPYITAVSLCYLAFWPRSETDQYRRRYPFSEFGRAQWGSETRLDAFLDRSRRMGYVLVDSDMPWRVAVPIHAPSGYCMAAVGVSLHGVERSERSRRRQALEMMLEAGARLRAALKAWETKK